MGTPKFKVGDKVRRKPAYQDGDRWTVGDAVVTVEDVFSDGIISIRDKVGCFARWDDKRFDLVETIDFQEATGKIKSDGGSTSYYAIPEGAKELLDLIMHKNMSYPVANIFKACYRLGEKEGNDLEYDLNKIIFFAQYLKDNIKNGNTA